MAFPVIERELKLASRHRKTYVVRFLIIGIATGLFVFNLVLSSATNYSGSAFFSLIQYCLFFYCIVEGVRATSDCLSEEERNGTLGLLFLTELRGVDVVMGKLISAATSSFYIFLGLLPLSGIALLLGGVTGEQFWRTNLILVCFLFFCLACGMFASSRTLKEGSAGIMTTGLVVFVCLIPLVIGGAVTSLNWVVDFSPWILLHRNLDNPGLATNAIYGTSLLVLFVISCAFILLAGHRVEILRSTLKSESRVRLTEKSFFTRITNNPKLREKALADEPVRYLLLRYRSTGLLVGVIGGANLLVGVAAAITGMEPVMWSGLLMGWISLKVIEIMLVSRTVGFFSSLRESGSLELLLTTPLSPEKIINGCEEGLIILVFLGMVVGAVGLGIHQGQRSMSGDGALGLVAVYMFIFLGDYHSAKWVAMANGLSERKAGTAFFKTLFFVFVLPLFTMILPIINVLAILAWPLFWCVWGSNRVRRTLAHWAEHSYESREDGSWFFFWKEKRLVSVPVPPPLPPRPLPTHHS
jgi:hypothetical protein